MNSLHNSGNSIRTLSFYIKSKYPEDTTIQMWCASLDRIAGDVNTTATVFSEVLNALGAKKSEDYR